MLYSQDSVVVDTIEEMEHIVANNTKLQWDGWEVYYASPSSFFNQKSIMSNGKWIMPKYVPLTSKGWIIPLKWLKQ